MANELKASDFVEVYHTDSTIMAQKILDVILAPGDIDGVLHNRRSEAFPSAAQPGGWFVAVHIDKRDEAVRLLKEALENGYIEKTDGVIIAD
jgi:hypothetical protein